MNKHEPAGPDRVSRPTPPAVAHAWGGRRLFSRPDAALPALALLLGSCGGIKPPPPPDPCQPGECNRSRAEMCVDGTCVPCEPDLTGVPWSHQVLPPICSTPDRPLKHHPPSEECPALVEPCQQPPPPAECTLGTPTAREALTAGMRPTLKVQRTGAMSISGTPVATFGPDYYCSDEMDWPEACDSGKRRGPVAPDGHPQRLACEAHFLGAPCPLFSMAECHGIGNECPLTFDPYIVIDGVNQNHPTNVAAGCREATWIKDTDGHVLSGEFWWSTAHGKGTIRACNADGSVCGSSRFVIDQGLLGLEP